MKTIVAVSALSAIGFAGCGGGEPTVSAPVVLRALKAAGFQTVGGYHIAIWRTGNGETMYIPLGCELLATRKVAVYRCPSPSFARDRYPLIHGFGSPFAADFRLVCNLILAVDRQAAPPVRARFEDAVATLRSRC